MTDGSGIEDYYVAQALYIKTSNPYASNPKLIHGKCYLHTADGVKLSATPWEPSKNTDAIIHYVGDDFKSLTYDGHCYTAELVGDHIGIATTAAQALCKAFIRKYGYKEYMQQIRKNYLSEEEIKNCMDGRSNGNQ